MSEEAKQQKQEKSGVPIARDASLYGDDDTGHLSNARYLAAKQNPALDRAKIDQPSSS
jgi:hypothetical protein